MCSSDLEGYEAGIALHVNEVQRLTVAATHRDEIQVVTTTADYLPEVQEVTISAPEDGQIVGNISLRFPEVQTVTITAGSAIPAGGEFTLNFTKPMPSRSANGELVHETATTGCLAFGVSAALLEEALNGMDSIGAGGVTVTRSGNGGAAYGYGYAYTVSFVGNAVAGNVPLLEAWNSTADGNSSCAEIGRAHV